MTFFEWTKVKCCFLLFRLLHVNIKQINYILNYTFFFISIQKQLKSFAPLQLCNLYTMHDIMSSNGCHNALWLLLYKKLNTLQAAWQLRRVKLLNVKYVRVGDKYFHSKKTKKQTQCKQNKKTSHVKQLQAKNNFSKKKKVLPKQSNLK